ncbi:hypothetical protein HMPREF9065_00616 [Aggregatibacter sp. oral taxon 458 str. W10330]|nr:hypothetical protein HMPREF9065_00616 [Aggregatibacter sp. oral taxon 458 str. W10330]
MQNAQEVNALKSQSLWNRAGSFDEKLKALDELLGSLNPFGTGRGLSTSKSSCMSDQLVSIPLEQGGVFRLSPGISHLT